jgi:hypothetical protein
MFLKSENMAPLASLVWIARKKPWNRRGHESNYEEHGMRFEEDAMNELLRRNSFTM